MEPKDRNRQIMLWYTMGALFVVLLLQFFWSSYSRVDTIPYSEFEKLVAEEARSPK